MALSEFTHLKRSEEGQGGGGGSRDALHGHVPDASSSPGGRCAALLFDDDEPPAGSRPDQLSAVSGLLEAGSAAQCGADRGDRAFGADP